MAAITGDFAESQEVEPPWQVIVGNIELWEIDNQSGCIPITMHLGIEFYGI